MTVNVNQGAAPADITPRGMSQRDFVDLLYMIVSSVKGICAKLDDDGGVPLTTYEANCYTAMFKTIIEDSRGNRTGVTGNHIITPTGVTDAALIELLYEIFNAFETLTEQLDTDNLGDSNYEALCYTAKFLGKVTNQAGNTLGNGTTFYFNPGGVRPEKELVNLLYNIVDAIETLTEKLDLDGTVTDTDYEALWFTANVLLRVENSTGSIVGN